MSSVAHAALLFAAVRGFPARSAFDVDSELESVEVAFQLDLRSTMAVPPATDADEPPASEALIEPPSEMAPDVVVPEPAVEPVEPPPELPEPALAEPEDPPGIEPATLAAPDSVEPLVADALVHESTEGLEPPPRIDTASTTKDTHPPLAGPPVPSRPLPTGTGAPVAPASPGTGVPHAVGETKPMTGTTANGPSGDDTLIDVKRLRVLRSERPVYPEDCRRRGIEGSVTCRLTIDRDGRVVDVSVSATSGSKALDDAALAALRRWKFASLEGVTTRDRVQALQRFMFELKHARR